MHYNHLFDESQTENTNGFKFTKTYSQEEVGKVDVLKKYQDVLIKHQQSMPGQPGVSEQVIIVENPNEMKNNTNSVESQPNEELNKESFKSKKTSSFVLTGDERRNLYKSQDTRKISQFLVKSMKTHINKDRTKVNYELSRDIYSIGFCLYYKRSDFIPFISEADILNQEKGEEVAHKLLCKKKIQDFIRHALFLLVITVLLQLGSLILLFLLVIDDSYVKPEEKGLLLILSRLVVVIVLTLIFFKNIQEAKLKVRFTMKQKEFPKYFGILSGLLQILVGICTQLVTIFTIMRSKDALQIFVDFAAFMLIIEIDDWIGEKFLLQKRKVFIQYTDMPTGVSDIGSFILNLDIDERYKQSKDRYSVLKGTAYQLSNLYLFLVWLLDLFQIYIYP